MNRLILFVALSLVVRSAWGQCPGTWVPSGEYGVIGGTPRSMVRWDPDGAGPRESVLVFGGTFQVAGGAVVNHVAYWEQGRWHPFGDGFSQYGNSANAFVAKLVAGLDGSLFAAGQFNRSGPRAVQTVARWSGSQWEQVGNAPTCIGITDLIQSPTGDLFLSDRYAGVYKFNGQSWSWLQGVGNPQQLLWSPTDGLLAANNNVLKWTGSAWTNLLPPSGPGRLPLQEATRLALTSTGELLVGGTEGSASSPVYRRAGDTWEPVGDRWGNGQCRSIAVSSTGELITAGYWHDDVREFAGVRTLTGGTWSSVAESNAIPERAFVDGNSLVTVGSFTLMNGVSASRIAVITDGQVLPLEQPRPPSFWRVASGPGGELFAGSLQSPEGRWLISRFDGTEWAQVASWNGRLWMDEFIALENGRLLITSGTVASESYVGQVLVLDGGTWQQLGPGVPGSFIRKVRIGPDGQFIAAMNGGVYRLQQNEWVRLGSTLSKATALAIGNDGAIYAAGDTVAGVAVVRFNGLDWEQLGGTIPAVSIPSGGVEQPYPTELFVLPDNRLLAGGWIETIGAVQVGNLAAWDGSGWSAVACPLDGGDPEFGVNWMQQGRDGRVWIGGLNTHNGSRSLMGSFDGSRWRVIGENWGPLAELPSGDLFAIGFPIIYNNQATEGYGWYRAPTADFDHDGDLATDADIEAFFSCLGGNCCSTCGSADFNGDGDFGTDQDIEAFFRVLAGGAC